MWQFNALGLCNFDHDKMKRNRILLPLKASVIHQNVTRQRAYSNADGPLRPLPALLAGISIYS